MTNRQARFERRLAQRRAATGELEALSIPPVEKRLGDERRVRSMSPHEVDDWLKQNHISGGDRRKGQRRKA